MYDFDNSDPLVVSNGIGVDSVAMLAEMERRGIRPDAILHAQVGDPTREDGQVEHPETYAYRPVLDAWLERVGFPAIIDVKYELKRPGKNGHYATIEENCLVNRTLPSLAFGRKGCSMKWKGAPLDAKARELFADHIARGGKVARAVGYDNGACDSRRGGVETKGPWAWIYPLRQWQMDRDACIRAIERAGLPVPHKSACFFCPSTKPAELIQLAKRHPNLARRAVELEDRARPNLKKISGLWGRGTKGMRGAEPKPGSWRDYLAVHAPEVLP